MAQALQELEVKVERKIPSDLAVLGHLKSIKIRGGRVWRPEGAALLATDPRGRNLYIVAGTVRWGPHKGSRADAKAKQFHGAEPSRQATVTVNDTVPEELNALGEVERIDYQPLEHTPKGDTLFFHNAGDTGPGNSGSVTILATDTNGNGAYLIVVKRGKNGYPRVTERGIVG